MSKNEEKVIKPKSINWFKDQSLIVKLENGVVLTLNFVVPESINISTYVCSL